MSKAQAKFIEHVFAILLGVIFMVSVIAIAYTFYIDVLRNEIRESLNQIALSVSGNVVRIYEISRSVDAQPSNQTSILIKEVDLSLPIEVSKRNYEVFLISPSPLWPVVTNITMGGENVTSIVKSSGPKVVVQTVQDPIIKVERDIPNLGIDMHGKSENGKEGKLRYYRSNINGTVYDIVVLGEAEILIRIDTIS